MMLTKEFPFVCAGEPGSLLSLIIRYLVLFNATYCQSLAELSRCTPLPSFAEEEATFPQSRDAPPTPPENFALEVKSMLHHTEQHGKVWKILSNFETLSTERTAVTNLTINLRTEEICLFHSHTGAPCTRH